MLQSLIKVKSKLEIAPVTEKVKSHLKLNYGKERSANVIDLLMLLEG